MSVGEKTPTIKTNHVAIRETPRNSADIQPRPIMLPAKASQVNQAKMEQIVRGVTPIVGDQAARCVQ
jgi:hypothetical protein